MELYPAIDLYDKCAVRLKRGDYDQMTVYSNDPASVAASFKEAGARWLHTVDLEGARDGGTPNCDVIESLARHSGLKVEIGGGIRDMQTVDKYIGAGVSRVILGTAALTDPDFLRGSVAKYGEKVAVGVDIKDGFVAIRGWRDVSGRECFDFCRELENIGVTTVICTDISRDGMLGGTNLDLYRELSREFKMEFIASGGVSTIEDIKALDAMGMSGAILGRALYEKTLDLKEALEAVG
ncbi:MAG: 1-(5-phosphoribosyl)-5-[Clostridia bacterium]|nr:1-(5-phosphoribosyl)-5-[(5-phosphoribosylamino)methylideneamino]imidazole-4-carboxamide isomerase [Clostridia bacterium]